MSEFAFADLIEYTILSLGGGMGNGKSWIPYFGNGVIPCN
jgi:hypothetical protein